MAKKPAAIYQPGELDRVRQNLGNMDPEEARRMATLLGGEVGVERVKEPPQHEKRSHRDRTVNVTVSGKASASSRSPKNRIETIDPANLRSRARRTVEQRSAAEEDSSVLAKLSYRERVRMDRHAAQAEFEIKNSAQVLYSMISLFGDPPDFVNPAFTMGRLNEYYNRLESLVTSTRSLLPRNNAQRSERFRKESPFAYSVIDLIRQWNIERISSDLTRLQSRPREVVVEDLSDILKLIYRPLLQLDRVDPERHIRESFRILYKLLLLENPSEAKNRYQGQVRSALVAYATVSKSLRFLLYPLLLKLLSDRWLSYEEFFETKIRRIDLFLGIGKTDRLVAPADFPATGQMGPNSEPNSGEEQEESQQTSDGESAEGKQNAQMISDELPRALKRGLETLEKLFPEAGWSRLNEFPDLYPYFTSIFDFKKGYELIAPDDPIQQIAILTHVLEELFYGLRFVSFGTIPDADGGAERVDESMNRIIGEWHFYIERVLGKEFLPRLSEYCRILDGSAETRTSVYTKRIYTELLWCKRFYFLPFFSFDAVGSPPFHREELKPFYAEIRELKRLLTGIAAGIEAGSRIGGADLRAPCEGIDNPWDIYNFQVPNPVSIRLDALLGGKNSKRRTNAALIFFVLAVVTVLDFIVNDENSWAYGENVGYLFRSEEGKGIKPIFGVDTSVDADTIFRRVMKEKRGTTSEKSAE